MNPTSAEIQATVKERFARVARSPDQENKFTVGPASARRLGYEPTEIDALPATVTEFFCGVGNPLGLATITSSVPLMPAFARRSGLRPAPTCCGDNSKRASSASRRRRGSL
jgi:hypothetical protein